MSSPSLRDERLAAAYRRTRGPVAFVDESYKARAFPGERPFYAMSAVTFDAAAMDEVREVLTEIAQGRYWHTTEAFRQGRQEDIADMCRYIADQVDWNVVAVEATISSDGMAAARQTCLAAIAKEVTRGDGPGAVRLVVADKNKDPALSVADQQTFSALRAAGWIDPNVRLYHGRMGAEPLLWSADLIAWSTYRVLAVDDDRWIKPVQDVLTMIDAVSGSTLDLDMNVPRGAAARGTEVPPKPGARTATGLSGPQHDVRVPSIPPASGFLEGIAAQSITARRSLGPSGHANLPGSVQTAARSATRWEVVRGTPQHRPEDDQPHRTPPGISR